MRKSVLPLRIAPESLPTVADTRRRTPPGKSSNARRSKGHRRAASAAARMAFVIAMTALGVSSLLVLHGDHPLEIAVMLAGITALTAIFVHCCGCAAGKRHCKSLMDGKAAHSPALLRFDYLRSRHLGRSRR